VYDAAFHKSSFEVSGLKRSLPRVADQSFVLAATITRRATIADTGHRCLLLSLFFYDQRVVTVERCYLLKAETAAELRHVEAKKKIMRSCSERWTIGVKEPLSH
jgi:hypothetical protein